MFSAKNTDTPNPFRPALQYLLKNGGTPRTTFNRRSNSIESLDSEDERERERARYNMNFQNQQSSSTLHAGSVPLITLSRSPSPFARKRSSSNPEADSEDEDSEHYATGRPFLLHDGSRKQGWKSVLQQGGLGHFFFNTSTGWQVYISILVLWVGGCGIGLVCMNRIVLLSMSSELFFMIILIYMQLACTNFHILSQRPFSNSS